MSARDPAAPVEPPDYTAPTEPLAAQPERPWADQPPPAARRPYAPPTVNPTDRLVRIIAFIFGVIEILLAIRVVLRLLGANPSASFTATIYGVSDPLVQPFANVFPNIGTGNNALELSALLAMVVYAIVAWVIISIVRLLDRRRSTPPTA